MTFLQAVAALIWADAGFKAASPGGIVAVVLPERCVLPMTTYQVVGGPSDPTFDTSGLQKLRVQFDCHAADYAGASAARDALVKFLNGYYGLLADGTYLQNADVISPIDFFDSDPRQFRCMTEFYLYFNFL